MGARVAVPRGESPPSSAIAGESSHIGGRRRMEDVHVMKVGKTFSLYAVFDGHGGKEAAILASNIVPGILEERIALFAAPERCDRGDEDGSDIEKSIGEDFEGKTVAREDDSSDEGSSQRSSSSIVTVSTVRGDEIPDVDGDGRKFQEEESIMFEAKMKGSIACSGNNNNCNDDADPEQKRKSLPRSLSSLIPSSPAVLSAKNMKRPKSFSKAAFTHTETNADVETTAAAAAAAAAKPRALFPDEMTAVDCLVRAFAEADEEILAKTKSSGTTAVMALLPPDVSPGSQYVIVNLGDSRAVLSTKGGKAVQISHDHKPSTPEETQRIREAGAVVIFGRINGEIAVSRSFGDAAYKGKMRGDFVSGVPDVFVRSVDPKDEFLILACDGVWDVMSNEEAVTTARNTWIAGKDCRGMAKAITDLALRKKQMGDNLTCVIVFIGSRTPPPKIF